MTFEDYYGGADATVIIDNRDKAIQGACIDNQTLLPDVMEFSRCLNVVGGSTNINLNTHTQTFQCVAAVVAAEPVPVPVLPWPALLLLGNLVAGLGVWQLVRRRKTE